MKIINISAEKLGDWIDKEGEKILLIDVREEEEFATAYIPGACFFPLSSFNSKEIPPHKNRRVVFYCAGGVRSMKAATYWGKEFGEGVEIYNLEEGINGWKRARLPVITDEEAKKKVLNQAHLLLGSIALLGLLLSLLLGPLLLLLPFFSSLMLLVAAFKGVVYLEIMVAKMRFLVPSTFR